MRKLIFVGLIALMGIFAVACDGVTNNSEVQRQQSVQTRTDTFAKAESLAPAYIPQNFPLRQALNDFTQREDQVDHPWYTYLIGQNGNYFGYFVTKTVPISTCDFLSSTENVRTSSWGNLVLTAPSLDGIYYGGSGATGGCGYFFFDYTTDTMITISPGQLFVSFDKPLKLDVQPIQISQ